MSQTVTRVDIKDLGGERLKEEVVWRIILV